MATQNRKSSSGRKQTTTRKNTSSGGKRSTGKRTAASGNRGGGKNNRKDGQGPDLVTVLVMLIAVVLVVVLISKYKDENQGEEVPTPTGAVTGTVTPETPTQEAAPDDKTPTKGAVTETTKAPKATATPLPTPTPVPLLSQVEAERIVADIVQLDNYTMELLDDHLMIDGEEYYSFCINNEKGVGLEPLLIVEKKEGAIFCYDLSGVVAPVAKFPLDKTETGGESTEQLSAEAAKEILKGYSKERLGLAKEMSAYEMTADDWTTMAEGVVCYGINLFETTEGKQRFRGTFYVAQDGSAVYSKDEMTGEFIRR